MESGEGEQDYPMAWDKIKPATYNAYDKYFSNFSSVKANSNKRVKDSPIFNLIDENAKRIKAENDKKVVSLNLKTYLAEDKLRKIESKKLEVLNKENSELIITTLDEDKKDLDSDKGKNDRAKDWYKNLKKDPYIFEALQVAEELK